MRHDEVPFMKSQNFEFLRPKRAVLADLAGFAERYAHDDPASSLIKQRSFVEHVVGAVYERYRLRPPFSGRGAQACLDRRPRRIVAGLHPSNPGADSRCARRRSLPTPGPDARAR